MKPSKHAAQHVQAYRYPAPHVPLSAIKRFAGRIVRKFHPKKIILFGSYAYGSPHEESDVDMLVIMPARNAIDQAVRICCAFDWPFSLDLIVRTPRQIELGSRDDDRDWFLSEILQKGKVLYEAPKPILGAQGRRGLGRGKDSGGSSQSRTKRVLLPLSTVGREVSQIRPSRTRLKRAANS
jgi:predicted nucleotidyltransferase